MEPRPKPGTWITVRYEAHRRVLIEVAAFAMVQGFLHGFLVAYVIWGVL